MAVKVNWTEIQVSAKELIGVVVFVLSMSGIYYKMYYGNDQTAKTVNNFINVTNARLDALEQNQEKQNKIFELQLQLLMDDYKARKAIEDYKRSSTEFVPLKQK